MKSNNRAKVAVRKFRGASPVQKLFLLDMLRDKDSRPIFYFASMFLFVGTLVYHWLEGWSYLDSFYFCVISLATVGYGDLSPTTPEAKIFTIVYVLNGVAILLAVFDRIRTVRTLRTNTQTRAVPDS